MKLREGLIKTIWTAKDVREDIKIVDCSRLDKRIVGIKRRIICAFSFCGDSTPKTNPDFPDEIEYVSVDAVYKNNLLDVIKKSDK